MFIFVAFKLCVKLSGVVNLSYNGVEIFIEFHDGFECILTLGQRRSIVSTQITIDAQMHLNQYVGTTMAQH